VSAATKKVFQEFDLDGDGAIDKHELKLAFEKAGTTPALKEIEDLIKEVDSNNSGKVELAEFEKLLDLVRFLITFRFVRFILLSFRSNQTRTPRNAAEWLNWSKCEWTMLESIRPRRTNGRKTKDRAAVFTDRGAAMCSKRMRFRRKARRRQKQDCGDATKCCKYMYKTLPKLHSIHFDDNNDSSRFTRSIVSRNAYKKVNISITNLRASLRKKKPF
jgi:hypothetical protein